MTFDGFASVLQVSGCQSAIGPRALKPHPSLASNVESLLHLGTRPRQKSCPPVHIWTMSDSREPPWSDNPNVPKIPYNMYFAEKCYFAGILLAAILYGMRCPICTSAHPYLICSGFPGILIVLFFQCIAALFSPANHRKEGVRWCVVCYTMLMFLFVTVLTGTDLHIQSICYVDNREYPGVENAIAPGPLGYRFLISSGALSITRSLMFFLNFWLADGLLVCSLSGPVPVRPGV